jgi:hypothetical protein
VHQDADGLLVDAGAAAADAVAALAFAHGWAPPEPVADDSSGRLRLRPALP